jgi:hypothetical protein
MNAAQRARDQRKADLVAATALLRPHAVGALRELTDAADDVAHRIGQVRSWLADPLIRRTGVTLAALVAVRRLLRRRPHAAARPLRTARWMTTLTLAWRLGRLAAPWVSAWLVRRRP